MDNLYLLIFTIVPFLMPDALKRQTSIAVLTILSVIYGVVAIGAVWDGGAIENIMWSVSPLTALFSLLFSVTFVPVLLLCGGGMRRGGVHKALFYGGTIMLLVSTNEVLRGFGGGLLDKMTEYGRVWPFLFSWEMMSVCSFLLLVFEVRRRRDFNVAILYFLLMQIGFVLLFFGLVGTGSGNQTLFGSGTVELLPWVLIFIGFCIKSAIFPFHFWLPSTYGISLGGGAALMSVSSTNIGVIGMFYLTYYARDVYAVSMVLMVLGLVSALYGAVMMIRSQRLVGVLSYSSIESLGVILFGFGFGYYAKTEGYNTIALLAMIASVLKLFSHAISKAQMLIVGGGVQDACGDGEGLVSGFSGLQSKVPNGGAVSFILGGLAHVSMPVFGSFLAKFMLFFALFQGVGELELSVVSVVAIIVLAMSISSSVFNVVKLLGVAFLGGGGAESKGVGEEVDSSLSMVVGQWIMGGVSTIGIWLLGYWLLSEGGSVFSVEVTDASWLMEVYLWLVIVVLVLLMVVGGVWAIRHYINKEYGEILVPPLGRDAEYTQSGESVLSAESFSEPANSMLQLSTDSSTENSDNVEDNKLNIIPLRFVHRLTGQLAFLHTGRVSHYVLHILWFLVMVLTLTICEIL